MVGEVDGEAAVLADDVGVGDDVTLFVVDDAGAQATLGCDLHDRGQGVVHDVYVAALQFLAERSRLGEELPAVLFG